jgi:uncharacterized membrane protein YbhN (UPF0104 family)
LLESLKSKKISFWIKSLIFILAVILLYYILSKNEKLDEHYIEELRQGWKHNSFYFILAFVLIVLNISLEAYKWKYLISKIEKLRFGQALEGVVTGVTMGFITPHSLGDYAARILTLTSAERTRGFGAVFLSRISQFYITLYFGTVSLVFYVYQVIQANEFNYNLIVWFTVFNNLLFILIFIYHKAIFRQVERWKTFQKIIPYFEIIKSYSFREINHVLLLSFFRYLVFSLQFILLLKFFDINLSWWLMLMGVSFIFFIKSVVPTFFDLGVRETAAVIFFGVFSNHHENIVFASLTLWLFNLALPAVVGLLFIFKIRIFASK